MRARSNPKRLARIKLKTRRHPKHAYTTQSHFIVFDSARRWQISGEVVGGGFFRSNMRLLFPVCFGLIVFYVFALPQFELAQNRVAKLVTIAVTR